MISCVHFDYVLQLRENTHKHTPIVLAWKSIVSFDNRGLLKPSSKATPTFSWFQVYRTYLQMRTKRQNGKTAACGPILHTKPAFKHRVRGQTVLADRLHPTFHTVCFKFHPYCPVGPTDSTAMQVE